MALNYFSWSNKKFYFGKENYLLRAIRKVCHCIMCIALKNLSISSETKIRYIELFKQELDHESEWSVTNDVKSQIQLFLKDGFSYCNYSSNYFTCVRVCKCYVHDDIEFSRPVCVI